jgi:hypothetical protein
MGVGGQDRVAVALPNGQEMAVAFLAIAAGVTTEISRLDFDLFCKLIPVKNFKELAINRIELEYLEDISTSTRLKVGWALPTKSLKILSRDGCRQCPPYSSIL